MRHDDVPVVGGSAAGTAPTSEQLGWLGLGAVFALAVVVAAVIALGTEAPPPTGTTVTTFPIFPGPRQVPPTLEWVAATGLDEAHSIAGVTPVDGRLLAVGETEDGVRTWWSEDGAEWSPGVTFDGTDGLSEMTDLAAAGGRLVVATMLHRPEQARSEAVAWWSEDGEEWTPVTLPSPNPRWIEARVEEVGLAGGVFAAIGSGDVRPDLSLLQVDLPDGAARLLAGGELQSRLVSGHLEATIAPDRVVYRVPLQQVTDGLLSFGRGPLTWRGDADGATIEGPTLAHLFGTAASDRLLAGRTNGSVVATRDGRSWSRSGVSAPGIEQTPYLEEIAAIDPAANHLYAVGTEERRTVWEPSVIEEFPPAARLVDLSTAGQALAAVAVVPRGETSEVVVGGDDDTVLVLEGNSQIQVLQSGRVAFYGTTSTAPLRLEPQTGMLQVMEPDSGEVLLELTPEAWLQGLAQGDFGATRPEEALLLHSGDGRSWSITPWHEITGDPLVVDPEVFVLDTVVMAVDQGVADGPATGVWVGREAG
jgi:hypothetical protein